MTVLENSCKQKDPLGILHLRGFPQPSNIKDMYSSYDEIKRDVDAGLNVRIRNGFSVRKYCNGYFLVHDMCKITMGTIESHSLSEFYLKEEVPMDLSVRALAEMMRLV